MHDQPDIFGFVGGIPDGQPVDALICDEAQFSSPRQVDALAQVVDPDVDVQAFGLLTDVTTQLFPGSKRLLELADRRPELQVEARCWCGERGTLDARTVGGRIQREGEQVVVGDVDDAVVAYEVWTTGRLVGIVINVRLKRSFSSVRDRWGGARRQNEGRASPHQGQRRRAGRARRVRHAGATIG